MNATDESVTKEERVAFWLVKRYTRRTNVLVQLESLAEQSHSVHKRCCWVLILSCMCRSAASWLRAPPHEGSVCKLQQRSETSHRQRTTNTSRFWHDVQPTSWTGMYGGQAPFLWTRGAPFIKNLYPLSIFCDTVYFVISSISYFRPVVLKFVPYHEIILVILFISQVELGHFWLTIQIIFSLLLVFSGAFECFMISLNLSLKMFQLKHLNSWWWFRSVFVFCCLYCVERTKSDHDEQSLDQTGKIEDHDSFFFLRHCLLSLSRFIFHREKRNIWQSISVVMP